ncbi:MAG: Z1 domain-containing protein [Thermoplasmataceae archaeon]
MNKDRALALARFLIDSGTKIEDAVNNPGIPEEHREWIRSELKKEENITLEPAHFVTAGASTDWLRNIDRADWYYWQRLREHLPIKGMSIPSIQSIDEVTDKILRQLGSPKSEQFDIRGLVLGYIQSGKTTNFTALMAKAADAGYRLFIVLSGIDKGLRRQTQMRIDRELIGLGDARGVTAKVPFPPQGKQWHRMTTDDIDGDFQSGTFNQAALQGPEPVIMVIKKNGPVIRRVLSWLSSAPPNTLREIPTMVIDDEADLASVDTRGSYQVSNEDLPPEYTEPSVMNGLIRQLLNYFRKKVYVAYTATPFANILIPHDTLDPRVQNDLYPKDFIVDLPKPDGYFGAEELFGKNNPATGDSEPRFDVIRIVPDEDSMKLENGSIPESLENALLDFVLTGAARAQRGDISKPCTMLIHTSHLTSAHATVEQIVRDRFNEYRNQWRYERQKAIRSRLKERWETDFRDVVQMVYPTKDVDFEAIEEFITPFFEAVQIRTVNSWTGEVIDYEREPEFKAIIIGGNRLSRGLTLEGLTISYFVRETNMYDTLMQMGRWFGYRRDYVDLTRIWTTRELSTWFADLAFVESGLREDIRVYEDLQETPYELGLRIWQHPSMQVTSALKRRHSRDVTLQQSYSGKVEQTFKYPFDQPDDLAEMTDNNIKLLTAFLNSIKQPKWDGNNPIWSGVSGDAILNFLSNFRQGKFPEKSSCSLPLISAYIRSRMNNDELINWTVGIMGLARKDPELGDTLWEVSGSKIHQISRTRLRDSNSLGVITSPGDEKLDLSKDEIEKFDEIKQTNSELADNVVARMCRDPQRGLLLIYPISRNSLPGTKTSKRRVPLFDGIEKAFQRDLVALAISFPHSKFRQPVLAYKTGTVDWRPNYDES